MHSAIPKPACLYHKLIVWIKRFFLLMVDLELEELYLRLGTAAWHNGKFSRCTLALGSAHAQTLKIYKRQSSISTFFLLYVSRNYQASMTANLTFLMYRCFLVAVDGSQRFTAELTVTSGFDILPSCRQFTSLHILPAKQPWLYHINEFVQLKIIINANLVKRSLIGKFHDCTREVVV